MPRALTSRRPHYAWMILGVTFLALLVGAGIRATPSVLIVPLEDEFGWSRSTISLAISVNIFLYGLMGPFAGGVMQRLGIRRTTLGALALLAIGVALATQMTHPWHLVLCGAWSSARGAEWWPSCWGRRWRTAGSARAGASPWARSPPAPPPASSSSCRCSRRSSSSTAGGPPRWSWRGAAALTDPGRRAPASRAARRRRAAALRRRGARAPGGGRPRRGADGARRAREGARSRDFWLLTATFFICGASTNGLIGTHLIPAAHDHGIPEVRAASLLALMGMFDLVGTTGAGWLSDRWSSRRLLACYYGLRGLSLFFLPFALSGSHAGLWVFAVWYGLDWIATVPPTLRLATDAFGAERAPIIFGWIGAGHQVGAALTAFAAGWIRTTQGDYRLAFWASGALCLLAAVLALQVGRAAGRRRLGGYGPAVPASAAPRT